MDKVFDYIWIIYLSVLFLFLYCNIALGILLSLNFLNNHLRYLKVMNDFSKGLNLVLCLFNFGN
jgi:ABC-type microcin C transport system permease subunit YejB